ncbi:DNA topoisomerase III [Bacillus spongiae]|uniref:DNA topoisomerase 3 n=1 Tax=Bacillus spongiae TaxID=2683610 RepID=A0ABU8HGM3_9BACI
MPKTVVLAEKPSVGRDIARVLGCKQGGNGFLEGPNYIVTWALGHLVTLADPESYDDKYKTWRIEDLPMLPRTLKHVVIKKTGKQFQTVKSQLNRKDVQDIVIATDAGREGELVARWIIEKARVNKPIKRLWISSVTDQAIKQGFNNLKPGRAYENLYHSAVARSEADWFVGMNATRALTVKHNAQLSCGRVQTPTLAMIAAREEEIKTFKPKTFFGIQLKSADFTYQWEDKKSGKSRLFEKEDSNNLVEKVKNKQLKIENITKQVKKKGAPSLYDLTELQRDGYKLFGYSAKETLSILQRLYEQHKLVTYPRTDSKYLSSDLVATLKDRIKACSIKEYRPITSRINADVKLGKSFVNNEKVTDHHAIIPTEQTAFLPKLTDKERKIYDLIVKRFLAIFLPPYQYERLRVEANVGNERFVSTEDRVMNMGWKMIYGEELDNNKMSKEAGLQKGALLPVTSVNVTEGQTQPPEPFNEGTILTAMENPVKFMANEKKSLKDTLGKTGGLGTVATRADIIEKLFKSFLIEKNGKALNVTKKGKQLLELAPSDLTSPTLTAEWEQKLEAISQGKLSKHAFLAEIKEYTKQSVAEIKNSNKKFKHDNISGTKCPDCGKFLLEVKGKTSKMLVCQDRDCGHRKTVSRSTNARCPNCRKKLELKGEGQGQIFVCSCGHREKLSTFQERKNNGKNTKATKRDVNKYMKNQQKSEPVNSALADALANFKLK